MDYKHTKINHIIDYISIVINYKYIKLDNIF